MKLSLPQKEINGALPSFTPQFKGSVLFFAGLKKSHPILDQTQGFGAVFPDFTEHFI
jgi:hypothetical protein